jgi:SAM-dependent methyltransferase
MHKLRVTRGNGLLEEFLARERSKLANRLIPFSHKKGSILDIGCGTFPFFLFNTAYSKKYGLDKIIRKGYDKHFQNRGITFINHDLEGLEKIPFESGFFDIATMLAVVEHIEREKAAQVFKEIRRILRPGGICVMTMPAVCARPLLRFMAILNLVSSVEIEEHKYAYSRRDIVSTLQEAGFAKEKIQAGYFFMNMWVTAVK